MSDTTTAFAAYLQKKAGQITAREFTRASACLLDYLAVTEAGAGKNRDRWLPVFPSLPQGNAPLLGYDRLTDGKTAALINGFNAHCLELDDGQRFAMIHLGASILSALLSVQAEHGLSRERFAAGVVMGYEAACRVAIAMQPSHKQRGFHTAGTCGTLGAAVGAAFALDYSAEQLGRTLTLAAGSAAGMLELQEQRSELKPYNLGRAAMDGLTAAFLGRTDFLCPDDMLGGERGFFRLYADAWAPEKLLAEQPWFEIERIYVKPYASCRHSHSAVEAAICLHPLIQGREIRDIRVETYRLGVKGHDHTKISGVASAKLSTPYAVAAALLRGKADLSVFEPPDEAALALCGRVSVVENEELTRESARKRVAVVTVRLTDGTELSHRVDYAKGEPENPMSREELLHKAASLVGPERVAQLMQNYQITI
ncbi:MAG: MmgE/PrpD family protein [Oscillospiraceae bacterium]|jgi:Uncharacterized protein involved in propionate catabolism|nr:MmgE/PrpD family protein [Oscillospiraceae bacterium]